MYGRVKSRGEIESVAQSGDRVMTAVQGMLKLGDTDVVGWRTVASCTIPCWEYDTPMDWEIEYTDEFGKRRG